MEPIIKSFSRVVRGIDESSHVLELYTTLEDALTSGQSATSAPALTPQQKRRILDFPEPDTQLANIAAACPAAEVTTGDATDTQVSAAKAALLQRAADSPRDLTDAEVNLLKLRYWAATPGADRSNEEKKALRASFQAYGAREDWLAALDRLKRVRAPLYDANEEAAIDNAVAEDTRRLVEAAQGGPGAKERAEEANRRSLAAARPWVRRMWEEDGHAEARAGLAHGGKAWGYPVYVAPRLLEEEEVETFEEYASRRDGALWWARNGARLGDVLGSRWLLQSLAWPEGVSSDLPTSGGAGGHVGSRARRLAFQKLRHDFATVVAGPPKKQTIVVPTERGKKAKFEQEVDLKGGLLRNVFLVIDQEAVDSTIGPQRGVVDDMWLWAVDPAYSDNVDDSDPTTSSAEEDETKDDEYHGFLRVRLQQLINNFYEVRRYQEEDYSLSSLWQLSQRSRNGLFISTKEEELNHWIPTRDVGSAIRPPKQSE
ncbi:hypothetical protein KVR01_004875 [Diaporthe batatas]|uniref:uncharacterized protein n=1 Tax=Diaporthe batatas TaxID=748121 RepID=UPI001D056F42|nr:uncharacterized protein KVR01_004875 [Diaporthe batatas]KAG8164600.1 hypothetical protein KVR01_004875 [Diaporthe batatas]